MWYLIWNFKLSLSGMGEGGISFWSPWTPLTLTQCFAVIPRTESWSIEPSDFWAFRLVDHVNGLFHNRLFIFLCLFQSSQLEPHVKLSEEVAQVLQQAILPVVWALLTETNNHIIFYCKFEQLYQISTKLGKGISKKGLICLKINLWTTKDILKKCFLSILSIVIAIYREGS